MRYMLLIYSDPAEWAKLSEAEQNANNMEYFAYQKEVEQRGVFLAGEPLQPVTTATTVRVRNGKRLTTDGPFAETKEQLAGFYLLNCKNLDEALELAAKIPGSRVGSIEVRPIMEMSMPPS